MKNIGYDSHCWRAAIFFALSLLLTPVLATAAEVFLPKERDSSGFAPLVNEYLNEVKSKQGILFYSGCHDKYGPAILLITNVRKDGLLIELDDSQLANIAFVDLKGYDGIGTQEMMGGMWVRNLAAYNLHQLVDMPFHIFSGKNPAELFDMKFPNKCKDYTGE